MNKMNKLAIPLLLAASLVAMDLGAAEKIPLAFEYDVSRGKIPTLQTLFRFVDFISSLGYDQFQLYGEHYFKYRGHEKVACRDAMTAEDVRALDDYCAKNGVELVPNQNSFGHMTPWLREYPELAELPKGVKLVQPRRVNVTGPGGTLCPTDPRSLALIDDIHGQFLPCFRSKLFNVNCDETVEILYADGRTRSAKEIAEKGPVRVYFDFLMKIHELVAKRNHRMMFAADIILHNPELIPELPKDVIAVSWGYEADSPFEREAAIFEKAGLDFYVCPGTSAWCSLAGRTDNMMANVDNALTAGFRHGMKGVILAEWGDGAHPQPFLASVPALIYTAHRFRGEKLTFDQLAVEIDRVLGCKIGRSLLRYGNLYKICGAQCANGTYLAAWLREGANFKRPKGMTDETLKATFAERAAARADRDLAGAPAWVKSDVEMIDLLYDAVEACARNEFGTIRSRFEKDYRRLWLEQNRQSGLDFSVHVNLPK